MSSRPVRIPPGAGRRWRRSSPSRPCRATSSFPSVKIYWDPRQLVHAPALELHNGAFVPFAEHPGRAEMMLAAIGPTELPVDHGEAPLLRVHPRCYLDFLGSAWTDWRAAGRPGDAAGYAWPVVGRRALDLD